ncbi:MAG: histidinol-phosphatase [Gemmatimonadetes bacterium]|nr:histidinol-phosphatase [Gemmatimonadota bacterium]MYD25562.1 histidinol-phosphatase [Gemmatimonadota bacterium]MYI98601.1 histidinol-phosphatase [Gemmatimonadota bacterium]
MASAPERVSVHGGHSGEFCGHAEDSLEEIVRAYIAHGYAWVGITEHMPPERDALSYPDELTTGLNAVDQQARFAEYMAACRRLRDQYASEIRILVAFETEAYSGYETWVPAMREAHEPEYIVGSVHQINDELFDGSPEWYRAAADTVGGVDELYCAYFDRQYEMITKLRPEVIGHFDLVRIFDPDYRARLVKPFVWDRVVRNLEAIRDIGSILDFNLAALKKGQAEPYVSRPVLEQALKMGVAVVPGDDSHGVGNVDRHWDEGIRFLREAGCDLNWKCPA